MKTVVENQDIVFELNDNLIPYVVKQNMKGNWFLKCKEACKTNTYIFHLLDIKDITAFCKKSSYIVTKCPTIFPMHSSAEGLTNTILNLKHLCNAKTNKEFNDYTF